jgi:hypothetical protein
MRVRVSGPIQVERTGIIPPIAQRARACCYELRIDRKLRVKVPMAEAPASWFRCEVCLQNINVRLGLNWNGLFMGLGRALLLSRRCRKSTSQWNPCSLMHRAPVRDYCIDYIQYIQI